MAKLLRARREIDYLHTHYWSKLPPLFQVSNAQRHSDEETETLANPNEPIDLQEPDSLDFFLVAASYQNIYHRKDFRMVQAVFAYLKQFHASPLPIRDITRSFCTDFFCFLQDKLHGNTPVNYFKKFKMCLEYCVEENLLPANPARGIRLSQYNDVTKEILSTKELIKLTLTPCRNPEVKRAFLFSCQSGLRWCDVQDLCYKNIDFAQRHLTLVQKKVAGHSQKSVLHLHLTYACCKNHTARPMTLYSDSLPIHTACGLLMNGLPMQACASIFRSIAHGIRSLLPLWHGEQVSKQPLLWQGIPAHGILKNTYISLINKNNRL